MAALDINVCPSDLVLRSNRALEGVFCRRFEDFMNNQDVCMVNLHGSKVFNLLSVAVSFGMIDEVVSMVRVCEYGSCVVKGGLEEESVDESVGTGPILLESSGEVP